MAVPGDFGIKLNSTNPGNYKTTCPKCSSNRKKKSDPCLSVTVEPDGSFVWNCHNVGCGFKGGGKPNDDPPRKKRPNGKHGEHYIPGLGEPEVYPYEDYFHVCRYETPDGGKTIKQFSKVDGQWTPRKPKGYNKLYRYDWLIWHPAKPVIVVEGERKCEAAGDLFPDFYVVSILGGASQAKNMDWSPLKDRDVYLFPDNDPPGMAAMQDAHAALAKIGVKSVTWVKPEESRPRNWDIGDWSDKDAEKFGDALAWMRQRIKDEKAAKSGPRVGIHLIPFNEIVLDDTETCIVPGVIPTDGIVVVWGPPKCGKSFFVSDLTLHIALGWPWRGHDVKAGPVVYVAAEGARGFKARIEAFRQERMAEHIGEVPFYLVPNTLDLINAHPDLINAIKDSIGSTRPAIVVIDTLNRTLNGSENKDEDMSAYIKAVDAVRQTFGCTVIIVHHCGVEGTRPRGHTSLTGALDTQIAVKKVDGTIMATVEYMKDGDEGEIFASTLNVVEVAKDKNDVPITSCVIEPANPVEEKDDYVNVGRSQTRRALYRIIEREYNNACVDAPVGTDTRPGHFGVALGTIRDLYFDAVRTVPDTFPDKSDRTLSDTSADTYRRKFDRDLMGLYNADIIGKNSEIVWLIRKKS